MNRAFTLVELLVVIGIMGLMGTVSVGGYRAMQRGMEERGVMETVNTLARTTYERAQIDRQPTAIYFWNETIRSESQDENEVVVGKAVAIRRQGRFTLVTGGLLIDEFSDLNLSYSTDETGGAAGGGSEEGGDGASDAGENTMNLYFLDNLNGSQEKVERSLVYTRVYGHEVNEVFMQGKPTDSDADSNYSNGKMTLWGFKFSPKNAFNQWKTGSSYGFEFAEITLPHNYIFGSTYSKTAEDPVRDAGTMLFRVGRNNGTNGAQGSLVEGDVTVYSLRPDGAGGLKAVQVDTVEKPK